MVDPVDPAIQDSPRETRGYEPCITHVLPTYYPYINHMMMHKADVFVFFGWVPDLCWMILQWISIINEWTWRPNPHQKNIATDPKACIKRPQLQTAPLNRTKTLYQR